MNLGNLSEVYVKLWVLLGKRIPTADENLAASEKLGLHFENIVSSNGSSGPADLIACGAESYTYSDGAVTKAELELILSEVGHALSTKTGETAIRKSSFNILEKIGLNPANSTTSVDLQGKLYALDGLRDLGFSVKSFVGGNPSLFNTNKDATAFPMAILPKEVPHLETLNHAITAKKSWFERVTLIENSGFTLRPVGAKGRELAKSLQLFGERFDTLLGGLLLVRAKTKVNEVKRCAQILCEESGLDLQTVEFQLKSFLKAAALGLTATKSWDGTLGMHGGYLVLKSDLSLVYIGVQNDDEFKNYLFEHTYFESPGYERHRFGFIYEDLGQMFFDLNLQLRFRER